MKTLVTGSTGFVGRELVQALQRKGNDLVCSTRQRPTSNSMRQPNVDYIHGEMTPDFNWGAALKGVDAIVHLAGRAHVSPSTSKKELLQFKLINVLGTQNLVQQAIASGVQRFIFISSIGVNGTETLEHPFIESDIPAPASAYATSKLEAELLLQDLCSASDMEWVILRPPLIYGPDAPGNLQRLMAAIARGIPLPLAGIKNRRSLLSRENLIDFISLCLIHPAAANQLFLVSDQEDIATPELVKLLALGMGCRPYLFSLPSRLIEFGTALLGRERTWQQLAGSLQVDSSKSLHLLGWHPTITLEKGIILTAERYARKK